MSEPTHSRTQAIRLFAHELAAATQTNTFDDGEKAPTYQLLPSGGRANRVFIVGTVTEIRDVGTTTEYLKARIVDPNGDAFRVYAGQYQPDPADTLSALEPPAYVAVVGKTSTYETDEGDIHVKITPESIQEVDEATRDRWVVDTAEQTFDRVEAGLDGVPAPGEAALDADLFEMALDTYGRDTADTVRRKAADAVATLDVEGGADEHVCEVCGDAFGSEHGLKTHQGQMNHTPAPSGEPAEQAAD